MRNLPTYLLSLIIVAGCCGCHRSGTWIDDSGNWERAFGHSPPKEIQIVHSIYWRTPHFTREDGWTFEIQSEPSFYKNWLAAYKVRHPGADELSILNDLKKRRPSWFLPKPLADYEIWVIDQPDQTFGMFIDKTTGEWFVTDGY